MSSGQEGAGPYGAPPASLPGPGTPYPAQGPPGWPAPAPPTNTMSILSLVGAILGVTLLPGLGSVVGVVLGHIALSQVKRTGENGRGLAVAGLVVGYAGIVLVGLLLFALLYAAAGLGAFVWMYS